MTTDQPYDNHNWPILETDRITLSHEAADYDVPDDVAYPHSLRRSVGADITDQAKAAGITAGQQLAHILRHSHSYADAGSKFNCDGKTIQYYLKKFGARQQRVVLNRGDTIVIRRARLPAAAKPEPETTA